MRKLAIVSTIIMLLVVLSTGNSQAQRRVRGTASEKAAYGQPSESFSTKKRKRGHKKKKSKQPASKNKKPLFRKKSAWVS